MRSRQTSIAVASCSAGSSSSVLTGCGPLTMTSWSPRAALAVNRSRLASGGGSGASGESAGYRFGTTRTVQPGVSGAPPPGRTANTSGGVRSSWPSAKGSFSGSMGGAGSARRPPPGRVARSEATIARRPVSGSTRTSGKRLLHRDVLDSRLDEVGAAGPVAVVSVEVDGVGLGVEDHAPPAARPRLLFGDVEELRAEAPAAVVLLDCQARELDGRARPHESARADDAALLDGDEVQALAIAAVELVGGRHALLAAEDLLAQRDGGVDLGGSGGAANLDAHRRAYRWMSRSRARSLVYGPACW